MVTIMSNDKTDISTLNKESTLLSSSTPSSSLKPPEISGNMMSSSSSTSTSSNQLNSIESSLKQSTKNNDLIEKKRKLTLSLPNTINSNSISSDTSSISSDSSSNYLANLINNEKNSNDTNQTTTQQQHQHPQLQLNNKRLKMVDGLGYLPNLGHSVSITSETPSMAKDLVNHLDNNNNLTTPQIEKLLESFGANNNLIKTPGSALALLTPGNPHGMSIFYQQLEQSQTLSSNNNTNNSNNTTTNNNNNNNSTNQENEQNYINLQNALLNNPQLNNQLNRTISEVAGAALTPTQSSINSLLMNPNNIFSNNSNHHQQQQQTQQQHLQPSPNTKYTTLTSMITASDLSLNENSNNDAIKHTGVNTNATFYVQQQQDSSTKLKDELQTVPIHPKNGKMMGSKKQRINKQMNGKKDEKKINETMSLTSATISQHLTLIDLKNENHEINLNGMTSQNQNGSSTMMHLSKRRDTENSISTNASSSNLDSSNFSPINLDSQETLKLEKKRERNREAARKCRTRKLEKIATLEQQVKNLIESNNLERAKTNTLNDEIVNLKKKLEAHQKLHNCNLNINSL